MVGFGGWALSVAGTLAPRTTDLLMEATGRRVQETDKRGRPDHRDNLYGPRNDETERSTVAGDARRTSFFLDAQLNPLANRLIDAGVSAAVALATPLLKGRRRRQ